MSPDLTATDVAVPLPRTDGESVGRGGAVEATITVDGDLSGQLAIGNNIWQMRIDQVHGNVVLPAEELPTVERRPPPLRLLPRPPRHVVRAREAASARDALSADLSVVVSGDPGAGKSTFLRQLAHDPGVPGPGGLVHLPVRNLPADDVRQCLFDLCYDTDRPYRPSPGRLRHYLEQIDCTFVLDDLELPAPDLTDLLDLAPRARVVLSRTAVVQLDGVRVLQLAPRAAHESAALHRPPPVADLEPADRALLAVLAAAPGLCLDAECLQQVTGVANAPEGLAALAAVGLVRTTDGVGFELTAGTAETLPADHVVSQRRLLADWLLAQAAGGFQDGSGGAAADGDLPDDGAARSRHRHLLISTAALLVLTLAGTRAWADVLALGRAVDRPLALSGRWDAWRQVLDAELGAARALDDVRAEALVLHQLGTRALCLGNLDGARSLLTQALRIRQAQRDAPGAAATRQNLDLLERLTTTDDPPSSGGTGGSLRRLLRRPAGLPLALTILLGLLLLLPLTVADATDPPSDAAANAKGTVPAAQQTQAPLHTVVPDRPVDTVEPSSSAPPSGRPAVVPVPVPLVTPTPAAPMGSRPGSRPAVHAAAVDPPPAVLRVEPARPVPAPAVPAPPVVVPDTTPPVLALPGTVTVEAIGPDGAPAPVSSTSARDDVSGSVPVRCDLPPGTVVPLGTTAVSCTAQDDAGNTASGSYVVVVADRTPPALTLPEPPPPALTAGVTSTGAQVYYGPATATDLVDTEVPTSCSPASGSWFLIGKSTVTCTATDSSGNTATGTFSVSVLEIGEG